MHIKCIKHSKFRCYVKLQTNAKRTKSNGMLTRTPQKCILWSTRENIDKKHEHHIPSDEGLQVSISHCKILSLPPE